MFNKEIKEQIKKLDETLLNHLSEFEQLIKFLDLAREDYIQNDLWFGKEIKQRFVKKPNKK